MTSTTPAARIFVTGGAGFIGSHVCTALLETGAELTCLDDLSTGRSANLDHLASYPGLRFVEGRVQDSALLDRLLPGHTAVVHLAALGSVPRSIADPPATEAANLKAFLVLLEAMRKAGLRRLVYASSSSVYGDSRVLPKLEGAEGRPISPYAVTKVMDEVYAGVYQRAYAMECIGLRFFNVFGERQDPAGPYAAAIPRFIEAFRKGIPPVVHGDGRQTRDFTYVANVVQAVQCALGPLDQHAFGEVYNVAYGASCDLLELLELIRTQLVAQAPHVAEVPIVHGPPRAGDVQASLAAVGKAERLLGFRAQVDLASGMERAVPWYAAQPL